MVVIELFYAPNQRRVRFLAHDDLPERIGCDQHGVRAGLDGHRVNALAQLQRPIEALNHRALGLRLGWLRLEP